MKTITNLSSVIDNSGDLPVITYSNAVTTIVNQSTPPPFIPRMAPCPPCNQCPCHCNCQCQCNRCCN